MSYTMSAQIVGIKELQEAFARSDEQVRKYFGEALMGSGYRIESIAKQNSPINFGQLRSSIHTQGPINTPNNIEVKVGTNVNYAEAMESGTRPHRPPIAALRTWAKYKLGNEKLAYPIANAIAKRGTKGRYYFKTAKENSLDYLSANIRSALDKVIRYLATA